jgi:hypothetical protein
MDKREQILEALAAFAAQRPGLEFGNYGDVSAYRAEMRAITKDLHTFRTLLAAVQWRTSIGETELRAAFRDAFSGRLTLSDKPDGSVELDYCTGQYFPTEYRKAACAVLASALWAYFRDGCMPAEVRQPDGDKLYRAPNGKGFVSAGTWLRSTFRREFGRSIASRYFD